MSNLTQDVTVYFVSLLSGAPPLSAPGNVFHYEVIVKDENVPVCVDCLLRRLTAFWAAGIHYLANKVAAATLNHSSTPVSIEK